MCEPRNRDNGASDVWALTAYGSFPKDQVVAFLQDSHNIQSAKAPIQGVPKKVERSIFVTLTIKNVAYFDFIR